MRLGIISIPCAEFINTSMSQFYGKINRNKELENMYHRCGGCVRFSTTVSFILIMYCWRQLLKSTSNYCKPFSTLART